MKIAFIGIKSYPPAHGGMETMTQSIVNSLLKMDIQKYVIFIYPLFSSIAPHSNQKNLYIHKIKTSNILYIRSILGILASIPKLFKDKPDVVHINGIENSYIIPLLRIMGYNVVLNIRGIRWTLSKWSDTYFHVSNIPIVITQIFFKINIVLFSWCANKIVTVNEYSIQSLPILVQKKTDVIYNSLEVNYLNAPEILEKLEVNKNEYILFIGRIVPLKGLHYLLNAYICGDKINEPLIVAGNFFPDRNKYHKYLNDFTVNNHNIKFCGSLYENDKFTIMSNAKLIVLPSETEGMAVTILEAAILKVPILVSNIPENEVLWKDAIHYFQNRNQIDLGLQLEILMRDDEKRENKLEEAYKKSMTKFNHNKQIDLYDKLYQSFKI